MTDKERIHRWITQSDLERMLDEAFQRGVASQTQGHEWTMAEGVWHCRQCYVVRDENPKPCRASA